MRTLLLLLTLSVIIACDRGSGPLTDSRDQAEAEPTAAYTRRMIFIGDRAAGPKVIAFDHLALAGPTSVDRRVSFWRGAPEGWSPLMDLRWSDSPIRDPWRLIPHRGFRFLVDDSGDVEALVGRTDTARFQLAPISRIGEWSPDDPPQFRINLGEWIVADDTTTGILVDIQPGVETVRETVGSTLLVLTDTRGFHLLARLPENTTGELWLHREERIETIGGVEIQRAAGSDSLGDGAWQVMNLLGEVTGRLEPVGPALELRYEGPTQTSEPVGASGIRLPFRGTQASGPDGSDGELQQPDLVPSPVDLQVVRGWIDVRGDRRNVSGVVRHSPK